MLKTLKSKIALVAVAGLGFGLVSTVPANAASAAADISFEVLAAGVTATVDTVVPAAGTATTGVTRAGQTISVDTVASADGDLAAATTAGAGGARFRVLFGGATGSWVDLVDATTVGTVVVPTGITTGDVEVEIDLDAVDGGGIVSSADMTLTVVNAGTPTTVAWETPNVTQLSGTAADRAINISPKDAAGVKTILLDNETIAVDLSPVTGVATSQVGLLAPGGANGAASIVVPVDATGTTGNYAVTINGDGSGAGVTGTTIPGTTYSLFAQLLNGTAAIGSPATATYKRLSNTASMAGSLSFVDSTTVTTAVASQSAANGIATTAFKVKALDSAGGVLQGATVTLSVTGVTGTFSNNSQATGTDGITATGMQFTPATSGSGTIVATITTGTGSITASIPVTVAAYGATAATVAGTTAVNVDGTGWKAGTAPAYAGSLNITKVKVTITGLDANKAVLLAGTAPAGGTATSDIGLNPIADANGTVVSTWTLTSVDNNDTFSVSADADGAGAAVTAVVTVATVTFTTSNTGSIVTTPATSTTSFAAPGATSTITATVTNQFGAVVSGGVVVFTNTTKPAAATAQTAATVSVDATGKATYNVVLGTAVGTYVYTANAKDVNGVNVSGAANTSTITYVVTASGAPKTITVTGGANTATNEFRVLVDADGTVDTDAGAAAGVAVGTTTNLIANTGSHTVMTVSVTDDAGAGVAGVLVTATPDAGVIVNSAAAANVTFPTFNEAADLSVATAAGGVATFYVSATKPGTLNVKFSAGSASATGTFKATLNSSLDVPAEKATGRTISLDKTTASITGNVVQVIATVKDIYGNAVAGVNLSGAITGTAGRFTGGGRTQAAVKSDANGQVVFEVTSNGAEAGTGTLTVTASDVTQAEGSAAAGTNSDKLISDDLSATSAAFGKLSTKSATSALTVTAAATTTPAIDAVKADVKAVSDTVATLSKAVTTIQSSVTELTSSFSAQIKSLSSAIAKISRAIAALSKKIK